MTHPDSRIPRLSHSSLNLKKSTGVLTERNVNEPLINHKSSFGELKRPDSNYKIGIKPSLEKKQNSEQKRSFSSGIPIPSSGSFHGIKQIQRSASFSNELPKPSFTDEHPKTPEPKSKKRQGTSFIPKINSPGLGEEFEKKLKHQKLVRECEIRTKELSELKNNVMTLMTQKHEFEFEIQKLEDSLKDLENQLNDNSKDFDEIDDLKEIKLKDLEERFRLEIEKLNEEKLREFEILKSEYNKLASEEGDSQELEKMEKDRQGLIEENKYLKKQWGEREINFTDSLKSLEINYQTRQSEIANDYEKKKGSLRKKLYEVDTKISSIKQDISKIEKTVRENTIKQSSLNIQVAKYQDISLELDQSAINLKNECKELNKEFKEYENKIQEMENYLKNCDSIHEVLRFELMEEETNRRKLHNRLLDLKGNIRVFCRIRPPKNPKETLSLEFPNSFEEGDEIVLRNENPKTNSINKYQNFVFDKVFQPSHNNADIFEEISQLVQSSLDGYNVCVFAYGQTGSGKTYTMSSKNDGMIPRAVDQIFQTSESLQEKGWDYQISGQFLEIYNETINDLLKSNNNSSKTSSPNKKVKLEIRHDSQTEKTSITNLTEIRLETPEKLNDILITVNNNKSVAATKANEHSSRSHTIFRIIIKGHNRLTNETSDGLLNLIDLAGSERLSHSQVTGHRLKETQAINKSLSCLGDVIYALGNRSVRSHVPFRNSKLTYLLQYSLSGSSKTLMFVNISPDKSHFGETLNSLRFASKVNSTKMNKR